MEWEAIGAIGEMIGALAVVVTLGYLAVQIRQNARMMESTRRHELARADLDALICFADHASVFAKMNRTEPPEWSSSEEREEAYWLTVAAFRSWENTAWQHANGFFETDEFEAQLEDIRARARFPYYVDHWARERHTYSPLLREIFDPIFGSSKSSSN